MFQAIKKAEKEVIELNKGQLDKGKDVFGNVVGRYKATTQSFANADGISKSKKEGDPYNFSWYGDFLDGFELAINNEEVTILSNVQGSTEKLNFLTTNNLYGLNDENLKLIIQTKVIPFINKFARATLKI